MHNFIKSSILFVLKNEVLYNTPKKPAETKLCGMRQVQIGVYKHVITAGHTSVFSTGTEYVEFQHFSV